MAGSITGGGGATAVAADRDTCSGPGAADAVRRAAGRGSTHHGAPGGHAQHVPGAISRVAPDATAYAHRKSPIILIVGRALEDDEAAARSWTEELAEALYQGKNGAYVTSSVRTMVIASRPRIRATRWLSCDGSRPRTTRQTSSPTTTTQRHTCDMATVPEDVTRYLRAVTARVRDVFGDRMVGVYTTGSLALGDYRLGRSDIDLMAVVAGSPDLDLRQRLARQLDHRALACPAAGLEFVLYPLTTVSRPTLDAGYLLNFNTGPALPPVTSFDPGDGPAFWYAIDRAITHQSGTSLYGPPAPQIFAALPFDDLLRVVIASVEAHSDPQEGHLLDNAVLNGCRALSFARDRRWYAKVDAAERTLPIADEFAPLVSAAIVSFDSGRREAATLDPDAVRAFLFEVLRRLRAQIGVNQPSRLS
jgi:hypothetical protein